MSVVRTIVRGTLLAAKLFSREDFQREFDAAKSELRKALGLEQK